LKNRFFSSEGRERLEALLDEAKIEPSRRAETLSVQEFAVLSDVLLAAGVTA